LHSMISLHFSADSPSDATEWTIGQRCCLPMCVRNVVHRAHHQQTTMFVLSPDGRTDATYHSHRQKVARLGACCVRVVGVRSVRNGTIRGFDHCRSFFHALRTTVGALSEHYVGSTAFFIINFNLRFLTFVVCHSFCVCEQMRAFGKGSGDGGSGGSGWVVSLLHHLIRM
jgi:hypothetical protein